MSGKKYKSAREELEAHGKRIQVICDSAFAPDGSITIDASLELDMYPEDIMRRMWKEEGTS